jgi:hypothetical protein
MVMRPRDSFTYKPTPAAEGNAFVY